MWACMHVGVWAWILACVCGFGFGLRVERLHHRNQINDEPRAQVVCSDAVESDCPLATVLLKRGEEPEHEIEAEHDQQRRVEVREKYLRDGSHAHFSWARLRMVLYSVWDERHQKAVMEAVS